MTHLPLPGVPGAAWKKGPLLVSNLVGGTPARAKLGAAVHVVFEKVTEDITLPKFVLA